MFTKKTMKTIRVLLGLLGGGLLYSTSLPAAKREVIGLSEYSWSITLDQKAEWRNEKLFLPPTDISQVPVRIPTGG